MLTTIYSKKAFLWAAFLKNIPKLLLCSCSVVCNPFWPHGLQHARLPGPSLFPGACPNSCPLSLWSHSTISFSVVPFSSCLQSFPAWGPFPMRQHFPSGGQSIGASAWVLPVTIQGCFPLGLTGLISMQSKGLSVFSSNTVQMHQFLIAQPSLMPHILMKKGSECYL